MTCQLSINIPKNSLYVKKSGFEAVYIVFYYFCSKALVVGTHLNLVALGSIEQSKSLHIKETRAFFHKFVADN